MSSAAHVLLVCVLQGPPCLCNRPCEVTPTYLPTWLYGHYSSKRGAWHKILRRAQFRRRIKAIRMRTLPTWNRSTRTLTVNVKTSPLAYSRHAELFALQRLTPRSRLPALVSRVRRWCRAVSSGVEGCRGQHYQTISLIT